MSTSTATRNESRFTLGSYPIAAGALSGLVAYLLGYLVVYVSQQGAVENELAGLNALAQFLGGNGIPTWKAVGWLFYSAHFVPLQIPLPGQGGTVTRNLVSSGQGSAAVLYFLAPVLLLGAGFVVARWSGTLDRPSDGAIAGSMIALGYVLPTIVGAVLLSASVMGVSVHLDLLSAAVLAGLVYPILFGALGGTLAAITAA